MGRNQQAPDRVARLEALKALLADRDVTTAGELADELGVSVRTLHRDLATLRGTRPPLTPPCDATRRCVAGDAGCCR
jgi:predicted DNA-binding transcriptional regulator YafY